jgi:alkyl hydroperoxide reductase subunit AhpF
MSCPHCPGAVQKAHKLAMMNKNVVGEMIEAQTFYELSEKYNVSGVPKIIINDTIELIGNQPIETFLSSIESL